jgi:hypothetical protein
MPAALVLLAHGGVPRRAVGCRHGVRRVLLLGSFRSALCLFSAMFGAVSNDCGLAKIQL